MSNELLLAKNKYHVQHIREGEVLWEDTIFNLIPTQGLNDIITQYYKGSSYTAAHYMGLKGTGSPAASDQLNSHPAWAELSGYTGNRKEIILGTVANGSVSNSGNRTQFDITATQTVAGMFLATVASGTSGVLASVLDFPSVRNVVSGDLIIVTITLSIGSA